MSAPCEPHRFCRIHGPTVGECARCTTKASPPPFQYYWRCAHHPSAIDNFFEKLAGCEWMCHAQELRWHHSGAHPMPKSWGSAHSAIPARHGMGSIADQIFGV